MDLRDTPEEAAFRAELRAWIDANLPEDRRGWRGGEQRFGDDFGREWSRALYEAGYAGLTWPKEYGGAGAPYSHQAIFYEEMARAQAPAHVGVIGLGMAGPTIMAHGTDEQKRAHLANILSAEEIWCQGFSEPGAGSDLAAARTRAERRGDVYVVNGQKVWSSFAHIADFCILVTQQFPDEPRYRNLTYLIVDMHSPGVEVRPLRQITGEAEFNEIFFSDVEVPVSNRLGDEGEGWQVAMTTLLHERGTLGFALTAALDVAVGRLLDTARARNGDDLHRERIAAEWIELQALRYTNYRSLGTYQRTGIPGPEGSAIKLRWSEQNQRLTKLGRELLGSEGILDDGWWHYQQLRSRGNTIEAGSSEVLRNIVAERVLGLPRSR
ncbi:MAG: acyl-CoA dehydrogenase family protein [Actinobacteria bacterium]|nr:acyl-CoA dehydrogenase family protein [Actinomycetota bacterium]